MNKSSLKYNRTVSSIVFLLAIVVSAFWVFGRYYDFYMSDFTGAIFELLWLPMLGMVFFIPIFSAFFWVKAKFSLKSLYFYTLLLCLATIVYMFMSDQSGNAM
ncbi:hypothetical protein [Maribellus mangrovi]|uniref:hypothetical protein n=1 Tax=Maribellus mangrovi TaxID=3133146 RepID=UPI0030EC0D5A